VFNIKLKSDECAVVIRAEGGDIFVTDDETPLGERSRYLLAIALHALRAEEDDQELWALLNRRIQIRADEYESCLTPGTARNPSPRRFRVIQGGLGALPTDEA
jgi:hypothetical protein